METLINHALRVHKVNKEIAQMYIRNLYEASRDIDTKEKLAALYMYFMPALPKKPRDDFGWVALACDTAGHRNNLKNVYSTGAQLVGTNGHTMHLTQTTISSGFYHPITQEGVELVESFPDFTRCLPKDLATLNLKPLNNTNYACTEVGGRLKPYICYDLGVEGYVWQKKYVDNALSGMSPEKVVFDIFSDAYLYITDGEKIAVIYGIRK